MSPILEATHVTHRFPGDTGIRGILDVSLSVAPGEVVCVLGPSGSGKSTLLRSLAGLDPLDAGSVRSSGPVGYVSQEYALWPHLSVIENLVLAPSSTRAADAGILRGRAQKLLARFDLSEQADRLPAKLSGGQRQRVALLRAVMAEPNVLLLDEVTSALDPELTKSVLDLIRTLSKDGYAMVLVTHHLSFALSVADRIVFLDEGTVRRDEAAVTFFSHQSDPKIKSFLIDIARRDESVEIFQGKEQFQAYHLGLLKRLPEGATIHVAGAVGDAWYRPMGDLYERYEELRFRKRIVWKMVSYERGEIDQRLEQEHPELNRFRSMPRTVRNPANYNVFGDTVITQIFDEEPVIIEVKGRQVAEAYLRFFEELWEAGTPKK